jgi:catechol 2,3-dioxygenase-like lactoylglutathione lyase family enzyme
MSDSHGSPALEPRPIRMGHIGIVVRDLDRTIEFYSEVVGLHLTERFTYPEETVGHGVTVAAAAFMRCDTNHHCISIFTLRRDVEADEHSGPGPGLHHIAFEMATPENLLAKFREVRARGLPIVNARRGGPGNQPRFYLHDPDGNLIEFYWGIDQVGWEGRPRAYGPIEEIDLLGFDFQRFVRERDEAVAEQADIPPASLVAGD